MFGVQGAFHLSELSNAPTKGQIDPQLQFPLFEEHYGVLNIEHGTSNIEMGRANMTERRYDLEDRLLEFGA